MSTALSIVALACTPGLAQAASGDGDADKSKPDIVVTGVRGSVEAARTKKKKAKQIVDSVVAEDVGKLPDNNVPEAIARVTGVQIDRKHGEGDSISIRGMTDISTTLNGHESTTGVDRSMKLADIPAELLKSVEVYKTRTADQVEGGVAGTVNVELRRPLDLPKGLTVAGSFREVFSSIGNTKSPYGSLLVADRFDTGIGEMGFLLNASYTRNHYNETFIESESPGTFWDTDKASLPADQQETTLAPYAVNYGVEEGRIKRPSLNAAWQWKASDSLDFVLEGTYFSSTERRGRDRLHMVVRNGNYNLSDISYIDNGNSDYQTVGSVTETPVEGTILNGGPESYFERVKTESYGGNFETHWHGEHTQINFGTQYDKSRRETYGILTTYRLTNAQSATVDLDADVGSGRGATVTYNGADLSDQSQYTLSNVHDERSVEHSRNFAAQVDLTQNLSETGLLRTFQMGTRFSNRKISYTNGYRDSNPQNDSGSSYVLSDLDYGTTTTSVGGSTWHHLDGEYLMDNFDDVRSWLTTTSTTGQDWSTEYPSLNQGNGYTNDENTFAVYGQFNYAFDAGLPVDGVFGLRAINTWGSSTSASYRYENNQETITRAAGRGNFIDLLPSANAIVHFTPKLQLRLSYTRNVQRPSFADLSPKRIVDTYSKNVWAGNPDLKAYTENNFDASLEYNFGRAGSLSLAGYVKKTYGNFYYDVRTEVIPELGYDADGNPITGDVWTTRNAGNGNFQGLELAGQTFFDFLPGWLKNFGAQANLTWLRKGTVQYPHGNDDNAIGMSKLTYNLILYYDTPKLSARVAWNYRSRYRTWVYAEYPEYSPYMDATSRLDAAVNFTPYKFVTFSVEGTNLLKNNAQMWWGKDRLLPYGVRLQARTVQLGARFRF